MHVHGVHVRGRERLAWLSIDSTASAVTTVPPRARREGSGCVRANDAARAALTHDAVLEYIVEPVMIEEEEKRHSYFLDNRLPPYICGKVFTKACLR